MFDSDPRITVITVTRNSAATLADTLRTFDAQDYPHREHLVIDGASSDGTLELLEQHASPRRSVLSEPDSGLYYAMNKGIDLATGEVVGFLNSDDFYVGNDVLSRVAEAFRDPTVGACYGDLRYVSQHNPQRLVRLWRAGPYRPGAFGRAWVPPHPTFFVRRSLLVRYGGFKTRYRISADFELMFRLLEQAQVRPVYLPGVMVHVRLGGISNRNLTNIRTGNREIVSVLRDAGYRVNTPSFLLQKTWKRLKQLTWTLAAR